MRGVRSFDHLVGAREQRRRNFQSERPRCAGVDHQLELRRPLDWEVAGLLALEDAGGVDAEQAITLVRICCIAHEPPAAANSRRKYTVGIAWRAASTTSCGACVKKNESVVTKSASARIWTSFAKATSMSRMVLAFRILMSCPAPRAAA